MSESNELNGEQEDVEVPVFRMLGQWVRRPKIAGSDSRRPRRPQQQD